MSIVFYKKIKIMPQQKATTTKPKSTTKPRKKVTKKSIQKEVYNSLTPRNILIASIVGLLLAIVIIIYNRCNGTENKNICYCENATAPIRSKSKFKDVNSEQLAHAQANGLKTIIKDKKHFESQIDSLVEEGILVRIKPNKPVITDERDTLKNLPIIISLLLIGNVKSVSSVPLSFSPAVESVAP